jgi:hypothetical protein
MGMSPEDAHALNEKNKADYEAKKAAATGAVMGDVATMMKTAAGRELLYKTANNVVDVGGVQEHRKTTLNFDPSSVEGKVTGSYDAAARNGVGENTTASYAGGDRQLFSALAQAEHVTSGTEQNGRLGDDNGATFDAHGYKHARNDHGKVSQADDGADRERAAVIGLDCYGTTLHGEKITENQYDKEQRANGGGAGLYPQLANVGQEWTYDNMVKNQ